MGGMTSTFRNNSELVDNLVSSRFITSEVIEHIFRAVDRGDFFPKEDRKNAYRDLAWNNGHIQISSPCIYGQIMEQFNFSPGLSFLNLGSGTGYLSTMVGLLLGPNGVNHGIEINEYLIDYANEKIDEFTNYSTALDEYEFSRPQFALGNCFCLSSNFPRYDRVYCGAACPLQYENYMKQLINVSGILIMVIDGVLTSYTRTSENTWVVKNLRTIYFASLIVTQSEDVEPFKVEPRSLQVICRSIIRTTLREMIDKEFGEEIAKARYVQDPQKKKRRILAPINEGSYLETIDTRNENYLMTLLDSFRHEPESMRAPGPIIDPAVYNELIQSVEFMADSANDPTLLENAGEGSRDEEISSSSSNDEPSSKTEIPVLLDQQPSTSTGATTSIENQIRTMQFSEQSESKIVIADDSNDAQIPVLSLPSFDVNTTNKNAVPKDVFVFKGNDAEPDNDNGQHETENNANESQPNLEELAPLLQSLARLGESTESNDDSDVEIMADDDEEEYEYISPYTSYMRAKILALPVPMKVKRYINLNRDFD